MASRVAKANARVQKKLRKAIDAGDLYSAQQMYMTLYHRSVRTNDSATAVSTIKDGVATMTEHAEWGCARELALLLVEVLKKNERILDDAAADDITAVFGYFAAAGEAESTAAGYDYMREAIAWAEKHSDEDDDGQGALLMRLHDDLATALRASGNFADAARHYTQGCRIGEFAEMLVAWAQQGSAGEQDLFLVRAVLQLLAWSRDDAAAVLIPRFAKEWEKATQSALETTPLVNFINLLLEAIGLGAPELFEELRSSYSVALARDPSFGDYLTIVADIYFGIRPPPKGGLFANLISSMMGGGDNGGSSKGRGRRRIGGGGGGGSGSGAAAPPASVVQEDVD